MAGFRKNCALKTAIILLLLCILARAEEWKELKGEHFIIYYAEDDKFAGEVLTQAEKYYERIASDLGYSRYDNFWQWDSRAKIYIYKDQGDFLRATGKKPWVHGTAIYDKKEIISYKWGRNFTDTLLPHELAHLIFRDFVGFKAEVPLWLDEGVSQWEEASKRKGAGIYVRELIRGRDYIPLSELMQVGEVSENDAVLSAKLYAQAVTLVGYLIESYGSAKFTLFCRQLRDGKTVDESLSFAYADSIPDIGVLEKKWLSYYGGS